VSIVSIVILAKEYNCRKPFLLWQTPFCDKYKYGS